MSVVNNLQRIRLSVTYDGTEFHGWQRQANTPYTIQQHLERVLSQVSNRFTTCISSGRTDAGVHARIQVVHADVPLKTVDMIEHKRLLHSLNGLLPPAIRILDIQKAPSTFHAIKSVRKKTYLYFIDTSPVQWPALRSYSWNLKRPLDWKKINHATVLFRGTHDFKAFCDADTTAKTTVRTLYEVSLGTLQESWWGPAPVHVLRFTGNGFLKRMVRSLAGSLVAIGQGRMTEQDLRQALKTQNRRLAGPTAPAHGLWLWDILYK